MPPQQKLKKMEIMKIDPSEYGLTDETAKNIQLQFAPMLQRMVELEDDFNAVMALPVEDPETAQKAKEVRLKYVKARTITADIHKTQKAFYLNGGRFVDGWKNAQVFASQGKEDALLQIETYFEVKERDRINVLTNERRELIRPYVDDAETANYGIMEQGVWDAFLMGKKVQWQEIEDAKEYDRQKQIEAAELEAKAKEAERIENERIRKEAELLRAELQKERDAAEKLAAATREEESRKAKEAEQAKIAAEKLAKAPVKEQLNVWVDLFELPETNYSGGKVELIQAKFNDFKVWAKKEIEMI